MLVPTIRTSYIVGRAQAKIKTQYSSSKVIISTLVTTECSTLLSTVPYVITRESRLAYFMGLW